MNQLIKGQKASQNIHYQNWNESKLTATIIEFELIKIYSLSCVIVSYVNSCINYIIVNMTKRNRQKREYTHQN